MTARPEPTLHSPKKSETIEIRLSFDAKQAFAAHCSAEQRTASEVLRAFIEERTTAGSIPPPPARRTMWRSLAAGIAGLALGLGVAAPSLAEGLDQTTHDCAPQHMGAQR